MPLATTPAASNMDELKSRLSLELALARINEYALVIYIKQALFQLKSVNTPNGNALVVIISSALRNAMKTESKAQRSLDLKKLAVWVGQITLAWL